MKTLLIVLHFLVLTSILGASDLFSADEIKPNGLSRFESIESRVNSKRVLNFEEIETLPEDISVAEVIKLFGIEGSEAPDIPLCFVYPREGQPRETKEDKFRYGFYFWPIWDGGDLSKTKLLCISFFPEKPKGEFLSDEWIASHKIIWPESKEGTGLNIERLHLYRIIQESKKVKPAGAINSEAAASPR